MFQVFQGCHFALKDSAIDAAGRKRHVGVQYRNVGCPGRPEQLDSCCKSVLDAGIKGRVLLQIGLDEVDDDQRCVVAESEPAAEAGLCVVLI